MAKYDLRLKARELRKQGISVKQIANQLGVSKSSASLWVRDIVLTIEQLEKLRHSEIKGAELGRLRSAFLQKQKRLEREEKLKREGIKMFSHITERELLIAGLALYWAEGSKKQRRLELCNSDPKMIKFFLHWLQKCFHVKPADLKCYVGINEMHRTREDSVKAYWSNLTGISLQQFTKTSFKKVKNRKVYSNFENHYGTFVIKVAKGGELYYKVLGLIEGLHFNSVGQGSSVVVAAVS